MNIGTEFSDLDIIVAVIAHSQIIAQIAVAAPPAHRYPFADPRPLPSGFGEVDAAVLEWIAAEGRRVGRAIARL